MEVYDGGVRYSRMGLKVLFWVDPNRYRAAIWSERTVRRWRVKTMVDKDRKRLRKRVGEWVAAYGATPVRRWDK